MSRSPTISVIIPVYNGEAFLAEAIGSVLAQTQPATEVLVVDDGSTDGSIKVAEGFGERVRLLRQANQGASAARNHGIRAARGELLAFLDADDRFVPEALALQLQRIRKYPEAGIVLGQFQDYAGAAPVGPAHEQLFTSFGCALIRRSVFAIVGPLREELRLAEDWDWFTRAREANIRLLIHRQVVMHRRLHDQNLTRQREAGAKFVLEALRRSLARRRQGAAPPTPLAPLASFLEPEEPAP